MHCEVMTYVTAYMLADGTPFANNLAGNVSRATTWFFRGLHDVLHEQIWLALLLLVLTDSPASA